MSPANSFTFHLLPASSSQPGRKSLLPTVPATGTRLLTPLPESSCGEKISVPTLQLRTLVFVSTCRQTAPHPPIVLRHSRRPTLLSARILNLPVSRQRSSACLRR